MRKSLVMAALLLGFFAYTLEGCKKKEQPPAPIQTRAATAPSIDSIADDKITIATFNIQIFGEHKKSDTEVMDVLSKIIRNFDVVAIQELKDSEGTILQYFIDRINSESQSKYAAVASPMIGRTEGRKEKYAFIYNAVKVTYLGSEHVYADMNNAFERPPYMAKFEAGKFDFTLVNIHTKPANAKEEIAALVDVVEEASACLNEKDVVTLGDFNADGAYFSEGTTTGFRDPRFFWAIMDDMDTTLAKKSNSYDRIVILKQYTEEDFAGETAVFRFDQTYNLSPEKAKKVSDHYPVSAKFFRNKDTD